MNGSQKASIGIVGAGPVAQSLATVLTRAGYSVSISARDPHAVSRRGNARIPVVFFADAADADIVMFALLHTASREVAERLAPQLVGKLVVDVDNAWLPGHYEQAGLSPSLTEGQWMANILPKSRVARAFSHIDWNLFGRGLERPGYWGAGYAADDAQSVDEVEQLISSVGFVPVRVGTLPTSSAVDVNGLLWSRLLPAERTAQVLRGP